MTDKLEFYETEFLRELTEARRRLGHDTEISDADHDIARKIARLDVRSTHKTVKDIDE